MKFSEENSGLLVSNYIIDLYYLRVNNRDQWVILLKKQKELIILLHIYNHTLIGSLPAPTLELLN